MYLFTAFFIFNFIIMPSSQVLAHTFSVSISSLWCGRPVSVSCFPFKHKITRSNTPFKHPLRSNTPTLHQEIPSSGEKTSVKLIKANVTALCRRQVTSWTYTDNTYRKIVLLTLSKRKCFVCLFWNNQKYPRVHLMTSPGVG